MFARPTTYPNEVPELIAKIVAVATCALALSACSAPASRSAAAASRPSAPARPPAATCETPQFTWSHVKSAPVLGAVSPRLDLTTGMKSDVPLEAVTLPAEPETRDALRARLRQEKQEAEGGGDDRTMISRAVFADGRTPRPAEPGR